MTDKNLVYYNPYRVPYKFYPTSDTQASHMESRLMLRQSFETSQNPIYNKGPGVFSGVKFRNIMTQNVKRPRTKLKI